MSSLKIKIEDFIKGFKSVENVIDFSKNSILKSYVDGEISEIDEELIAKIEELNNIEEVDEFIKESKKNSKSSYYDVKSFYNKTTEDMFNEISKILFRRENIIFKESVVININVKNNELECSKKIISNNLSSIEKIKIGDDRFDIDIDENSFIYFPEGDGGGLSVIRW